MSPDSGAGVVYPDVWGRISASWYQHASEGSFAGCQGWANQVKVNELSLPYSTFEA